MTRDKPKASNWIMTAKNSGLTRVIVRVLAKGWLELWCAYSRVALPKSSSSQTRCTHFCAAVSASLTEAAHHANREEHSQSGDHALSRFRNLAVWNHARQQYVKTVSGCVFTGTWERRRLFWCSVTGQSAEIFLFININQSYENITAVTQVPTRTATWLGTYGEPQFSSIHLEKSVFQLLTAC